MQKDQHSGYINARMISDVVHMGPNKGSKTSNTISLIVVSPLL